MVNSWTYIHRIEEENQPDLREYERISVQEPVSVGWEIWYGFESCSVGNPDRTETINLHPWIGLHKQNFLKSVLINNYFRILPVNDRPKIVLTESVLKVGAGGTLPLSPTLVSIQDPDTRTDQIIIVVSYNDSRLILFFKILFCLII